MHRFLTAAALLLPLSAAAAEPIAQGTTFTVTDLHPDDVYYPQKGTLIGSTCTATGTLVENADGFYGGPATCSGGAYYFFKARLQVSGGQAPVAPAAPSVASGGPIARGTTFVVVDIDPSDAYFGSKGEVIGNNCVATDTLTDNGGGFYGGAAMCGQTSRYFFKARLQITGSAPVSTSVAVDPTQGWQGDVLGGATFRVMGVSSEDAYTSDTTVPGLVCTASDNLTPQGPGYFSGPAMCADGARDMYFYQAVIELISQGTGVSMPSGTAFNGPGVPKKATVQIVDLSSSDAFYGFKDALVGQTCTVKKPLQPTGDGWFGGTLKCGKAKLVFYQVGVSVISF